MPLIVLTILVIWILHSVNGNDIGQPRQLLKSISGDTVRMECNRTVEGNVDWKVEYDPKDITRYICLRGRLLDKYKPRFELDPDNYTLTIHDVMVNDSGLYYCVDDEGFGQPHFTRLDVVLPPPGQLSLVNRTETSLTIRFNQTGRVTGYNVSVNGRLTSDVTYSGIGQAIATATVHNLIAGYRYSISVRPSSDGIYSKNSTAGRYQTVPAAPGPLSLVNRTEKCLTISWNQTGRVTKYSAVLDNTSSVHNAEYVGVGNESVTAVLCCLSTGTKYKVNIAADSDGDVSQATSGDFETLPGPPRLPPLQVIAEHSISLLVSLVIAVVGYIILGCIVRLGLHDNKHRALSLTAKIKYERRAAASIVSLLKPSATRHHTDAGCQKSGGGDMYRMLLVSAAKPTRADRVEEMVRCLNLREDSAYEQFREILCQFDQRQFVNEHMPSTEGVEPKLKESTTNPQDRKSRESDVLSRNQLHAQKMVRQLPTTLADAFDKKRTLLRRRIKADGLLLDILLDMKLIRNEDKSNILNPIKTDEQRSSELMDILERLRNMKVCDFFTALHESGQDGVLEDVFKFRWQANGEFVAIEQMETTAGVPDEVPTRKRIGLVPGECAPTVAKEYDKRRRREEPDGRYRGTTSCYIAALGIVLAAGVAVRVGYVQLSTTGKPITDTTPSQQESQPGEQSKEQNWFKAAFKNCRAKLVDSIDVEHNLLTLMRDKEVLTPRQIEDIKSKQTSSEKVERMLDLLEKRDNVRFKRFCEALIEDDQEHIIDKCLRKYCP